MSLQAPGTAPALSRKIWTKIFERDFNVLRSTGEEISREWRCRKLHEPSFTSSTRWRMPGIWIFGSIYNVKAKTTNWKGKITVEGHLFYATILITFFLNVKLRFFFFWTVINRIWGQRTNWGINWQDYFMVQCQDWLIMVLYKLKKAMKAFC